MQMSSMDTETGEMIVKRVSVPIGLEELMEGLTKEILLKKPDDIYLFAAEYFAQLLLLREKGSYKVKTSRTAQSISKQLPKQPPEKLLIRGASKQLSRQISVRGESPVKRVPPIKKPLRKDPKEDKSVEKNKFIDRRNKPKHTESAETKNIEAKPKHIISRPASDSIDVLNKRDRSVSSNRRGRSVTKNIQGSPRQKSTSTPRRAQNSTEKDKNAKSQNKDDVNQQTQNKVEENPSVPKISSVEEDRDFIKDGKLTVTPPKVIKRPQIPANDELISSVTVPQMGESVASVNQNIISDESNKEVKDINSKVADLLETNKEDTNLEEHKTPSEKDEVIEEINNKEQIKNAADETQNKINIDLDNTRPKVEKDVSISIDDESETQSISSIVGKGALTNLSNINDKQFDESKTIDFVEKHGDSHDINNTDNTSDDQITNLITDDSSASDILNKDTEDTKLTNENKLILNIKENDESSSLLSETDVIKDDNDKSKLTLSENNDSDTMKDAVLSDHQELLKDDSISSEAQFEAARKNTLSEGNENRENKGLKEETILNSGKNIKTSENHELDMEIQKKNNGSLEEVVKNEYEHGGDRDEEIKKNDSKEDSLKDVNGKEKVVIDSEEGITKPESHNHHIKEDNLKQKSEVDEDETGHNNYPDKEIDAGKGHTHLHENVLESKEEDNIDLPIHKKENLEDQIEKNEESVEKERNMETDINLMGVESSENELTRVKREAAAFDDSAVSKVTEGDKITQIIESGEDKLTDNENGNTNLKRDPNEIDNINSQMVTNEEEKAEEITEYDNKSHHIKQESSDLPIEKQHDGAILPTSNESHLKNQGQISEIEENPRTGLNTKAIEVDKEKIGVVNSEQNKSNLDTDTVSMDEKIPSLEEDDKQTNSSTEAEKSEHKESSESSEELTPRTNILIEHVENTPVTDKNNSNEPIKGNLIETVENTSEIDKESTKGPTDEHFIENVENLVIDKENTKKSLKENADVDNISKQDEEVSVITKLEINDEEKKDIDEIDNNNEESTNSITNEDTSMKEHLDKVSKNFEDKGAINSINIDDTVKEKEKAKIETVSLEPDSTTKNNEKINNKNDEENIFSESEILNNMESINKEDDQSQKTASTISTDNITDSSDANKENLENIEPHKQEKYTNILGDQEGIHNTNIIESNVNETDDKINVKETPVSKNEINTDLTENQHLQEKRVIFPVDIDHDKEGKVSDKEKGEDINIMKTADSIEEDNKLKNYNDLSTRKELNKNDNMKNNDSNVSSNLASTDKTIIENELKNKPNELELQVHNFKDDGTESIISVINVAKDGPVDHVVKKYIGDFIQQEQQHVFFGNSDQMDSKDILNESIQPKEIAENVLVEKNEVLTNERNKSETYKTETKDVDKDLMKNDVMKNIVNSTVSLAQTGKVDEILKVHINDFLSSEKKNVFSANNEINNTSNSLTESNQKQTKINEDEYDIKEANHKSAEADNKKKSESINRKDSSKNLKQSETNAQKMKQNGKNINLSQLNIKPPEENFKQNNKNKPEKKLRRVKTVDVIKDGSRPKTEVKSRIPTADYRNRVKGEKENGKHSVLIKQPFSSQEIVNKLPGKVVDTVNIIDKNVEITKLNKQDDEMVKDQNEHSEHKVHGELKIQQSSKDLKETEKSELNKSGFDHSKLREELKDVETESKFATFKPSFNPYVLRQEIKNASLSDNNNDEIIGSNETSNFITQIAAALKIQSVWRGFKVRKNKVKIQQTEPKTITENKDFQLVPQDDEHLKVRDITENNIKPDRIIIDKDGANIENKESKQDLNGIKSESNKDSRGVQLKSQVNQNERIVDITKSEHYTEDSKMSPQQKADIEVISSDKDSQIVLKDDKNLEEKNAFKTDSISIEKQNTLKTDNNESKSDQNEIIKSSENDHDSQEKEKLHSQEIHDEKSVEYSKLEKVKFEDVHSNQINEEKFIEAAVMIQKIWRAFKVRKNIKQKYLEQKSNHKNNESFPENKVNNKVDVENELGTLKSESDLPKSENSHTAIEKFTKAAITIQKIWRGFKIRKNIKENYKEKHNLKVKDDVTELYSSKSKEIARQSKTELNEPKIDIEPRDFSYLTNDKFRKSALIIQKLWRGFNARKILKQNNQGSTKKEHQVKSEQSSIQINKEDNKKESIEEVVNKKVFENLKSEVTPDISAELIDQKNGRFIKAATKIQSLWRGFQVRKVLRANNKQNISIAQVNIEHNKETSQITTEKSQVKSEKQLDTFEPDNDEFVKAAIKIQKIWRGFNVRKVLKKSDLFGTRVELEKPVIESTKTVEEIHPKDKKSALKIQSLWRGYQVRKNINIIKDKLEEGITTNDAGKGKELTDGDIMNAATKIQAGVRGYLQRKKYKRDTGNLNSIPEEDIDGKHDTSSLNIEPSTDKSTKNLEERKLSENEVFKALEDLNKLEIPNDIPLKDEIKKPSFYRSHTVQESEIVKKQSSPLLRAASLNKINDTQEETEVHGKNQSTENFKDSNNNSSEKLTSLEKEVREAAQNITKTNEHNLLSHTMPPAYHEVKAILANTETDSESLISEDVKQLGANDETYLLQENRERNNDSKVKSNLETVNVMDKPNKLDAADENTLYHSRNQKFEADNQIADNHEKNNRSSTSLSKTESSSNIFVSENQQTEINRPLKDDSTGDNNHNQDLLHADDEIPSTNIFNDNFPTQNNINKNLNDQKELHTTELRFDGLSKQAESENVQSSINQTVEITPPEFVDAAKDTLSNDEETNKTLDEKLIDERPVSIDSTDSAVTVIANQLSGDNEEDSNESEVEAKKDKEEADNTKETLLEHENLINDFQNKLLDQISGKNGEKTLVEDVNKKFDIEQLRKELKEAGVIYNNDDTINIQHQNSKEESNVHDQLLDYLHNSELTKLDTENEVNTNSLPRDLTDIKEEDSETKPAEDTKHGKENIVLDKTTKTNNNESINGDIPNNEIDIEKLQSTLKECENIAHEINKGIKLENGQQPTDKKITLMEAENDSLEYKLTARGNSTDPIESRTAFCAIPEGKTFENKHIDEKPLSDHIELINVNTNSDIRKNSDCETTDEHIKLEADNPIPTDLSSNKEASQTNSSSGSRLLHTGELHDSVLASLPLTSDTDSQEPDSLENMITELSSQDATLSSTALNSKLLHTGEFHDTVVVPLPLKVKNDLKTEIEEQGNSISNNSEQLVTTQSSLEHITTKNIASEEFQSPKNNLPTTTRLLHTGELHDSVVVPLSIETQHALGEENERNEVFTPKSTEIEARELPELSQQNLSTNESQREPSAPTYTRLLHTGELHDTVVVPIPNVGQHITSTEDNEVGSNQPENTPRQVDSESQTTGQVHAVPIEVQLNQAPAGVEVLTSPRPVSAVHGVSSVEDDIAQTPDKGALPIESRSDFSSPSDTQSMESETRKNATINNKSMEVEAATKIQAGFRGYQVRKQLKLKNGSSDINNQRRQLRRKSSGRITDNGRISQNKPKDPNDIEEKSAVKIQAGVRGFLVRRRQKKQKTQES